MSDPAAIGLSATSPERSGREGHKLGEGPLQPACDFHALRTGVALLPSEVVFETWPAEQLFAAGRLPGLLVATNWRVIFIQPGGEFAAFPTPKIELARTVDCAELILSVWYGRLVLAFDDGATASAVEARLRQGQLRTDALMTPMRASPDPRRSAALLLGQAEGRAHEPAEHPLLMLEPSL